MADWTSYASITGSEGQATEVVNIQPTTVRSTFHDLVQPKYFLGFFPSFGQDSARGVLMLVKGAELYKEAARIDLLIRLEAEPGNVSRPRIMLPPKVSIRDAQNGRYLVQLRDGGGGERGGNQSEWSWTYIVTPAIREQTAEVELIIQQVDWQRLGNGAEYELTPEPIRGPWIIRLTRSAVG